VKKFLVPIAVGVVVFGGVTAFAASLTVNSKSLAAGNGTIAACNSSAAAAYTSTLATSGGNTGKYVVTGGSLTTDGLSPSACKGMSYKVTLLDGSNASLGEATGTLADPPGDATLNFSGTPPLASAVVGIAVVITG
jgi:hypothetical protein